MEHIKSFQSFSKYMEEVQARKVKEEKAASQAKYAKFFQSKLEEYGVFSPAELDEEKRTQFYNEINSWNGSEVNEADVSSKEEFKDYVYALYKKAFGDEFDEKKADEVINGLIKKHKDDWGAMVGAAQSSLGESVTESTLTEGETEFFTWLNGFIVEKELSKLQKDYQEYFKALLDEFGVKSPGELSEEKKKEFFNKVKSSWEKGKGVKKK